MVEAFVRENIRKLRKRKGLTLSEMAEACNCSPGLLSQLETGAVTPSLSTLKAVADVLGVSLGELFSGSPRKEPKVHHLIKETERKVMTVEGGIQFQLLTRSLDVTFEFILNRWPPGTSTGKKPYSHNGKECGLLLKGELEVEINGVAYKMVPGDSITLDSSNLHRVTNTGSEEAVAIWVNSDPWCFCIK